MIPAALLLVLTPAADAKETLNEVFDHYASLKSFSMTIEHDHSSGLFPGLYTQELKWKEGGKFELKVTKPAKYTKEDKRRNEAPLYLANGDDVLSVYPDGRTMRSPLSPDENTMPGWEVAGGPIVSFLQKTHSSEIYRNPEKTFKCEYSFGKATQWSGMAVREIVMNISTGQGTAPAIHWYLDPKAPKLLGMAVDSPGMPKGSAIYKNQVDNPKLPDDLGKQKG